MRHKVTCKQRRDVGAAGQGGWDASTSSKLTMPFESSGPNRGSEASGIPSTSSSGGSSFLFLLLRHPIAPRSLAVFVGFAEPSQETTDPTLEVRWVKSRSNPSFTRYPYDLARRARARRVVTLGAGRRMQVHSSKMPVPTTPKLQNSCKKGVVAESCWLRGEWGWHRGPTSLPRRW